MQTRLASSLLTRTTFILVLVVIGVLPSLAVDYRFTTIGRAFGGVGNSDGPGNEAQFNTPQGLARDAQGNVFVADRLNHTIRKITSNGTVTTLAGRPGKSGNTDGPAALAQFSHPQDVAVAADGSVYVANAGNFPAIRRISPEGMVTTVVSSGVLAPVSLAINESGDLFIADSSLNAIFRYNTNDGMQPFAGGSGTGSSDGIGSAAQFNSPRSLTVGPVGNIYVTDTLNYTIRKITPTGTVSTFSGQSGSRFFGGTTRSTATYDFPDGIAADAQGNVFVICQDTIWKIGSDDQVTAYAGTIGGGPFVIYKYVNAQGIEARFDSPSDLSISPDGTLWVADVENHSIRKIDPDRNVSALAGSPNIAASFMVNPTGMTLMPNGDALVSVTGSGTIVRVTPDGEISPFAGTEGNIPRFTSESGIFVFNRLIDNTREHFFATSIAIDPSGNIYAPDRDSIRKMSTNGVVTTIAGNAEERGTADAQGTSARFYQPGAIDIDSVGNLYVADKGNHTIRKISPNGNVITFVGKAGEKGLVDGQGENARLQNLTSIEIDAADNLWIGAGSNIRKVTPDGTVTTVAGRLDGRGGLGDAVGTDAYLGSSLDLEFDESGSLWFTDASNSAVRVMHPNLQVETHGGFKGQRSFTDGVGAESRFNQPEGILVFANGNLLIADSKNNALRLGTPFVESVAFLGTYFGTTASGAHWALWVDVPGHGIFTTQIPNSSAALVAEVTLNEKDEFDGSAFETLPTTSVGTPRLIDVSGSILQLSQGVIHVEGQLGPSNESFTGQFPRSPAGIQFSGSYYTAIALGTESGTLRTSVGLSGDFYSVITLADQIDSARGLLDPQGQAVVTTQSGAQLTLAIDLNARTTTASLALIPPSANAQRERSVEADSFEHVSSADETSRTIRFAGLAAGVKPTTRLANLSIRSQAGTGDETLIMGFVVAGPGTKPALLRGIGPTLADFGLSGTLTNPRLRLFDQTSTTSPIEENDDWSGTTDLRNLFSTLGAFPLDNTSQDAAIFRSLPAGPYTAQITASETGIALAEAYDSGTGRETRFVNLSARTNAGIGAEVLTAGFVVTGNSPVKLLVRGIGPTLGSLGVAGVLSDPILRVFDQDGTSIAENDNWDGAVELSTAFATVGAFGLSSTDSKDAAMIVSLVPGSYTVQLSGSFNDVGVALVELYEMP